MGEDKVDGLTSGFWIYLGWLKEKLLKRLGLDQGVRIKE